MPKLTVPRFISIIASFAILASGHAAAGQIAGKPVITDGDTIVLGGKTKIRLAGIDAPETDQVCLNRDQQRYFCGLQARDALTRIVGGREITCEGNQHDRYGRQVMTCWVDGDDINAAMVESGWALAFVRYSGAYVRQEAAARDRQAGLWGGAFIAPWDWRHRGPKTIILGSVTVPIDAQKQLLPSNPLAEGAVPGCTIKGNINRKGERIYHVPGSRGYDKTRIVERDGERWFCSEEEAKAAGWRKSRL